MITAVLPDVQVTVNVCDTPGRVIFEVVEYLCVVSLYSSESPVMVNAASASAGSTTTGAAKTLTVNTLVSETSPKVRVAVRETTVSASPLVTTPVLEITAVLFEVHVTVTVPLVVGKVMFFVIVWSVSPV